MQVRMQAPMAGPGVYRDVGETIEVGPEEGARLVAAGLAEEVAKATSKPPAKRSRKATSKAAEDSEKR